jgi:hypothetical protein
MEAIKEEKMALRALKHQSKERLAILTTPTVYFSDLEGNIFHHFPNKKFNAKPYSEIVAFPGDFESAKHRYFSELEAKRMAAAKSASEAAYQARREKVLTLWRWRHGELECYVVSSFKWATDDELNWDREEYEYEVFFDVEEAMVYFDEVVEENKDFCEAGYRFFVQLTKINTTDRGGRIIDIPASERLGITSVDDIYEEFMPCSEEGNVRTEAIDFVIPDDGVVVTSYRGEWRYASWAARRSYGDLSVDRGDFHYSDDVYFLSELSPVRDYELLQFIIDKMDLTREDLTEYMDGEELAMLFEEEDEDE